MIELHRVLAEFRAGGAAEQTAPAGHDSDDSHRNSSTNGTLHTPTPACTLFSDAAYRLGTYTDGTLVRLRGVIVDVQDPELVLLAATDEQQAHAATDDVITAADESPAFIERVPLQVALFPHRTEWAQRAYDAGLAAPVVDTSSASAIAANSKGTKRSSEAVSTELPPTATTTTTTIASSSPQANGADAALKKARASSLSAADDTTDASDTALFHRDVVTVFVYDQQYGPQLALDAFRVNESFDFVGVLDLLVAGSSATDASVDATAALSATELARLQISDCLDDVQPRRAGAIVHCCAATPVTSLQHLWPHADDTATCTGFAASPLLQTNAARQQFCSDAWSRLSMNSTAPALADSIASVRSQAIAYLAANACEHDALAAEYLLLCLLSRVYSRPEPSTPLGSLSLNLVLNKRLNTNSTAARVERIDAAIRTLVPVCASLDLALTTLNRSSNAFVPRKDYATGLMQAGALQLPHGAVLVVDETQLAAGDLNAHGVKNVAALQSLVQKLLLPYDFAFYSMDFAQDVAVVTLSDDSKSILPVTVSVPVNATDKATEKIEDETLVERLRVYFAVVRTFDVAISSDLADVAEKHYVSCRQAKQEVSLDDLHRWLRLARLVALSEGDDTVTQRAWDHMLAMEEKRLERIA